MNKLNRYTIDELNNMQLEDLLKIEKDVYKYFKAVRAIIKLQEALDEEDEE